MIKVHKHVSKLSGLKRLLENTFQNGLLVFIFTRRDSSGI